MIKITYYRENNDPESSVVGYFGLYIDAGEWDFYFSKLRLINNKEGGRFIAPPSEKFTTSEGIEKYANFFWAGSKSKDKFQKEVIKAINEWNAKNKPSALQGSSKIPQQKKMPSGLPLTPSQEYPGTGHYTAPEQKMESKHSEANDDLPF